MARNGASSIEASGGVDFELIRHPVPTGLKHHVLRISGYRESAAGTLRQTESASLVAPLILSFGAPFEIGLGREPDPGDRYHSFVAGLYGGPVHIRSHGGACCLQIDFTPTGAYRFFGLPMDALADRMVAVADLDDRSLNEFAGRLGELDTWPARFALAERILAARLAGSGAGSPAVAAAYERIVAAGGNLSVTGLAGAFGWSRKHLAARFREETGMTPKAVARIARFGRAQALAGSGSADGWADVAAACGYADQAHLVREFRVFSGAAPGRWPIRETEAR